MFSASENVNSKSQNAKNVLAKLTSMSLNLDISGTKTLRVEVFACLGSSDGFLSAIFGIFGKFRIDIDKNIFETLFFSRSKKYGFGFCSRFFRFVHEIFLTDFFLFRKKIFREKCFSCRSEIFQRFQKSHFERLITTANAPKMPNPVF